MYDEKNDISAGNPEQVGVMSKQIEDWMRSVVGSLNGNDY